MKESFRLGQIRAEEYQRAVLVPAVRGKREPRGRMITDSEIRALMQVCAADPTPMGARDAAIIAVLRGTGLRRSEVAALDVADYDPQTGAIVVRAGKGNKDRRVYARSGTIAALDAWLGVRGRDAGALFGRAVRGGRVGERRLGDEGVTVILRDRAAAAGVAPFTPHDMRRTYISELLDAGADLATVQESAKPPILGMCRSSHGNPERASTESITASASCRKPAPYAQVTVLERTLVSYLVAVQSAFVRCSAAWRASTVLLGRPSLVPISYPRMLAIYLLPNP